MSVKCQKRTLCKQLLRDIFIGTTVQRVIRTGSCPVLMVNNEVDEPYRKVLVPIDVSKFCAACRQGLPGDAAEQ